MAPKRDKGSFDREPKAKATQQAPAKAKLVVDDSVPIFSRKIDLLYMFGYFLWFLVTLNIVVSRCPHVFPKDFFGVDLHQSVCRVLKHLEFKHAVESHQAWGEKIFTAEQDFSLTLVHQLNVIFTGPWALFLAWGFFSGSQWTKNWGMIHAAVVLYNILVVDISVFKILDDPAFPEAAGPHARIQALIIYGIATVFPLVLMHRLWHQRPFSKEALYRNRSFLVSAFVNLWKLFLLVWMLAAIVCYYEFCIKNAKSLKHLPSVVDNAGPVMMEQAGNLKGMFDDMVASVQGPAPAPTA